MGNVAMRVMEDAQPWGDVTCMGGNMEHILCKGTRDAVPQCLRVHSPNGQHMCAGEFTLVPFEQPNSYPLWRKQGNSKDVGDRWLYSSQFGRWNIGGHMAKDTNFQCDYAHITTEHKHNGVMPHLVDEGSWLRTDGMRYQRDRFITVTCPMSSFPMARDDRVPWEDFEPSRSTGGQVPLHFSCSSSSSAPSAPWSCSAGQQKQCHGSSSFAPQSRERRDMPKHEPVLPEEGAHHPQCHLLSAWQDQGSSSFTQSKQKKPGPAVSVMLTDEEVVVMRPAPRIHLGDGALPACASQPKERSRVHSRVHSRERERDADLSARILLHSMDQRSPRNSSKIPCVDAPRGPQEQLRRSASRERDRPLSRDRDRPLSRDRDRPSSLDSRTSKEFRDVDSAHPGPPRGSRTSTAATSRGVSRSPPTHRSATSVLQGSDPSWRERTYLPPNNDWAIEQRGRESAPLILPPPSNALPAGALDVQELSRRLTLLKVERDSAAAERRSRSPSERRSRSPTNHDAWVQMHEMDRLKRSPLSTDRSNSHAAVERNPYYVGGGFAP